MSHSQRVMCELRTCRDCGTGYRYIDFEPIAIRATARPAFRHTPAAAAAAKPYSTPRSTPTGTARSAPSTPPSSERTPAMALVTVIGARHRDGWLSVDTTDWIADRAEFNEHLTDWLVDWLYHGIPAHGIGPDWPRDPDGALYPTTVVVTAWMRHRSGIDPTGIYGEDGITSTLTSNYDNLLSDDIGYIFARCGEDKLLIVTANEFRFCSPRVYDYTASDDAYALDTGTAFGACRNDHRYTVESGVYLNPEVFDPPSCKVADRIRVPFGDTARAYVACPDCGTALHFTTATG